MSDDKIKGLAPSLVIIDELADVDRALAIQEPTLSSASNHYWGDFGFDGLVDEAWSERERQLSRWGVQERASGTSSARWGQDLKQARRTYADALEVGRVTWVHILNEEVLEAFEATDPDELRKELVQVIAVAAGWILDLDRRGTEAPETTDIARDQAAEAREQ